MTSVLDLISSKESFGLLFVVVLFGFSFLIYKIKEIENHLTNHVTGTERKIDKLDTKIGDLDRKLDMKIDKLDTKIGDLDRKLDMKIDKLDTKIGDLKDLIVKNA